MSAHRRPGAAALAGLLALGLLAACRDAGPPPRAAVPRGDEVVVASFNFSESSVLAEIYAGALEAAGVPVRRELGLGPRELVRPALLEGLVDLVPEYLGTALSTLDPSAVETPGDPVVARRRLAGALAPWAVEVLDPAAAENQNGLAVTRATAERHGLATVSDLAPIAGRLTLGGPPECPQRTYCLPGLERVYGLRFGRFVPFDTERQRATALTDQVVDVAVMFTTDGRLATGDLVLLRDDRDLQPAEHVVPVVSTVAVDRHGDRLVDAVNAVSSRLTTSGLRFLNWRVAVAGHGPAAEARGWLERHGLTPASG